MKIYRADINPIEIIEKYYEKESRLYKIILEHSKLVSKKAIDIAKKFNENLDLIFIKEASMLHDIGIYKVNGKNSNGKFPYSTHGFWGSEILISDWNLLNHAYVCKWHGVDNARYLPFIKEKRVPDEYVEIISLADLFFSKGYYEEWSINEIREILDNYDFHNNDSNTEKLEKRTELFDRWIKKYL